MSVELKERFVNLSIEKQKKILSECRKEFASCGYDKTSTNTIVSKLGIAKGSFFKYFGSKENLYLYLITEIYQEASKKQGNPQYYRQKDLFARLDELLGYSMKYCKENPLKYKLVLEGELNTTSSMYNKVLEVKKKYSGDSLWAIYEGVEWTLYSMSKEEIITVFTWFLKGVKEDLRERISVGLSIEDYEKILQERISIYKKAIFNGIYKE